MGQSRPVTSCRFFAVYYGSQRTRKQAKEAPEHPLETDQQRRVRLHEETELEGEQSQRNREKTRLAKRNARDRARRRGCKESAEDKAARA